eukprot:CAMPEP_0201598712 /NCGR_PEP_ID=MMETSP0492-20130828/432_1 /ASSEMBLY_ACC=CAM_ASM_000837 /TAXON_ID=420259 /ORGANISM="Thalassiosira gravida, Strain GMp14c1" /LENGTH=361 /DNA_ID=CAMNT_0048061165 /DNA_START=66 /DNA_END=1151 /DNA_ORIENTATION=-
MYSHASNSSSTAKTDLCSAVDNARMELLVARTKEVNSKWQKESTIKSVGQCVSGTDTPRAAGNEAAQEPDTTFPQQLMDVIEQETKEGTIVNGERVLEWLPMGDAFVIRDKASLEKKVLPMHFNVKCKFASFVRKLYRWGFRQVEKELHGIMIFMHPYFFRGDKRRCLNMRSIVKKPQARAFTTNLFTDRLPDIDVNVLQAFGSHSTQPNVHFGMKMAARQVYPSLDQGGFNSQIHPGLKQGMDYSSGLGESSTIFTPNRLPHDSMGLTSTEMFEAGLQLRKMEQRRERQMQLMDMLNTRKVMHSTSSCSPPVVSSNQFDNFNNHSFGGVSKEVKLASEIMFRYPSMEPSRALELANRFDN